MAAATESAQFGQGFSPQEILQEVRNFLHGANYKIQNQRHRESLAQSALVLLRTLPPARQAVFEFLAGMFDEAVNGYLLEMDIGHKVTEASGQSMDGLLHDACGVLHTFIQTNSVAWAPIISAWSLELLGHISCKYSERRGVPPTGSLNELLQLWLTCTSTKLLIEVATECFAQMVGGSPENCVDTLLEASVKYSPHFDWVVAHIGSSFPRTIINRVLMCGLKDYCHHGNHGDSGDSDAKIPKMGSVVGILGHLAAKHGHDIRDALMKLFKESLEDSGGGQQRVTTIPFLLQLASMSPLLLHILATDLVKTLSAPVLNRLHIQFQPWIKSYPSEFDSMMSLVVHLVMQSDTGADKALHFLLYNATVTQDTLPPESQMPAPEIQKACGLLIGQILNETQSVVFRRGRIDSSLEVPFLGALSSQLPQLTQDMMNSDGKRTEWLQRLICYIVLYKGEKHGAETLAFILSQATTTKQLRQLVAIQQSVEVGMSQVLAGCAQLTVDRLCNHGDEDKLRLLNNVYALTEWEDTPTNPVMRSTFKASLQKHWTSLSGLLVHPDPQVAMVTLQLLNHVGVPDDLAGGAVLKACGAVVALFFRLLEEEDTRASQPMIHACKRCAQYLSRKPYAQSVFLRYLMEAAVDQENRHLLGGTIVRPKSATAGDAEKVLVHQNRGHGLSLTLLRSHSSVFHAGVIGQGLQPSPVVQPVTEELCKRNTCYLLEMLWICAKDHTLPQPLVPAPTDSSEDKTLVKPQGLRISADLCRMLGNMIVELTTPDVLYNNRFWPEEESLKMTVERDLQVWKTFDDNPVLWDILELLAGNTLVMSRSSAVLKSLTATMMHHFESVRDLAGNNSQKQIKCCCHIIHCLGKSGLLPAPLGLLSELFPFVTPFETFLLLLMVWRYMKENPPTEDPIEVTRRACERRHIELVISIVHKHIDKVGNLYSRFFKDHRRPTNPPVTVKQEPETIELN